MYLTDQIDSSCPYCSEAISLIVDCSVPEQNYIEDCQVCCRPIVVNLVVDEDGQAHVSLQDENA